MGDIRCINYAARILKEKENERKIKDYFDRVTEALENHNFEEVKEFLSQILETDPENKKAIILEQKLKVPEKGGNLQDSTGTDLVNFIREK